MTLDFDLEDGIPWDFGFTFQGRFYPVRKPTAIELARMADLKTGTREAAAVGQIEMMIALTGLDRTLAQSIDSETLWAFMEALGDVVVKVLQVKGGIRKQRRAVDVAAMPAVTKQVN